MSLGRGRGSRTPAGPCVDRNESGEGRGQVHKYQFLAKCDTVEPPHLKNTFGLRTPP